jgi:hypothetical protein
VSNREEATSRLGPKLGSEKAKGHVVAVLGGLASCGPWTALLSSRWTRSIFLPLSPGFTVKPVHGPVGPVHTFPLSSVFTARWAPAASSSGGLYDSLARPLRASMCLRPQEGHKGEVEAAC